MRCLSALVLLMLAVGVYSNCGCLKCNKQLRIVSPPGSPVKVIYKASSCNCPTGVPYSIDVPVPVAQPYTTAGRDYGYRVQTALPAPCPYPKAYNVQLQVPAYQPQPTYLTGLTPRVDRILIQGPEPLPPPPGCPRPIIEAVQVVPRGEACDNSCYAPRPACYSYGRYDRNSYPFSQKSPQVTPNTPLVPLELLQRHSYTPPWSQLEITSSPETTPPKFWHVQNPQEHFSNLALGKSRHLDSAKRSDENAGSFNPNDHEERLQNLAPMCKGCFQPLESHPEPDRLCFCQLRQKSPEISTSGQENPNEFEASPNFSYKQILKPKPETFGQADIGRKVTTDPGSEIKNFKNPFLGSALNREQAWENLNPQNTQANPDSDLKHRSKVQNSDIQQSRSFQNSFQKVLGGFLDDIKNHQFSFQASSSKIFHVDKTGIQNSAIEYRHRLAETLDDNSVSFDIRKELVGRVRSSEGSPNNSQDDQTNFEHKSQNAVKLFLNLEKASPLLKPLAKIFILEEQDLQESTKGFGTISFSDKETIEIVQNFDNKESPENNINNITANQNNTTDDRGNFGIKIFCDTLGLDFSQKQPENNSGSEQIPQRLQTSTTSFPMDPMQNFQESDANLQNQANTKAFANLMQSQNLILKEGDSGFKSSFLRANPNYNTNFNPQPAETPDCSRSKRSINMRLLALHPENPPRYQRMHNLFSKHSSNNGNAEDASKMILGSPLGDRPGRLRALTNRGRKLALGTKKPPRLPRDNLSKLQLKQNNIMLKANLKRTNKIIKDCLSKVSPVSAPEIQRPSFVPVSSDASSWWMVENQANEPPTKRRFGLKSPDRHKRAIRTWNKNDSPFYAAPDSEEMDQEIVKSPRYYYKPQKLHPAKPFKEPFNYDHVVHPTPILNLLNAPIRYLSHVHKLRNHVSPAGNTIPKVIDTSRRYVIDLLRNFGKTAIDFGASFVKNFTKLKRKPNLLPKRRFRRNAVFPEYTPGETCDLKNQYFAFVNPWENKQDEEGERGTYGIAGSGGEKTLKTILGSLSQDELQGVFAQVAKQLLSCLPGFGIKDLAEVKTLCDGRRRKREIDTSDDEPATTKSDNMREKEVILMDFLRYLEMKTKLLESAQKHDGENKEFTDKKRKNYKSDQSSLEKQDNLFVEKRKKRQVPGYGSQLYFGDFECPNCRKRREIGKETGESVESSGDLNQKVPSEKKEDSLGNNDSVGQNINQLKRKKRQIPGYGNPMYTMDYRCPNCRRKREVEKHFERNVYQCSDLNQDVPSGENGEGLISTDFVHQDNDKLKREKRQVQGYGNQIYLVSCTCPNCRSKREVEERIGKNVDPPTVLIKNVPPEYNEEASGNDEFVGQSTNVPPEKFLYSVDDPKVFLNSGSENEDFLNPGKEKDARLDLFPQESPEKDFLQLKNITEGREKKETRETQGDLVGETENSEKSESWSKIQSPDNNEKLFSDDETLKNLKNNNTKSNTEFVSEAGTIEDFRKKRRRGIKTLEGRKVGQKSPKSFPTNDDGFASSNLPTTGKTNLEVTESNTEDEAKLESTTPSEKTKEVSSEPYANFEAEEEKKPKPLVDQNRILRITEEFNEILAQPASKSLHPSELDIQVQTIKDKIAQILSKIRELLNYDVSKDLGLCQNLLRLQDIKSDIVKKWKALISNSFDDTEVNFELLSELEKAEKLKESVFHEITQKINGQENISPRKWIKILVRLQKFHCMLRNLNERLSEDHHDFDIKVLENLDVATSSGEEEILASLEKDQEVELERQLTLLGNLKMILDRRNGNEIKEEARIIWEINNVEKLQKVSILELHQKFFQGLKVRKELKILFDLQKQLEDCEDKQMALIEGLELNDGAKGEKEPENELKK